MCEAELGRNSKRCVHWRPKEALISALLLAGTSTFASAQEPPCSLQSVSADNNVQACDIEKLADAKGPEGVNCIRTALAAAAAVANYASCLERRIEADKALIILYRSQSDARQSAYDLGVEEFSNKLSAMQTVDNMNVIKNLNVAGDIFQQGTKINTRHFPSVGDGGAPMGRQMLWEVDGGPEQGQHPYIAMVYYACAGSGATIADFVAAAKVAPQIYRLTPNKPPMLDWFSNGLAWTPRPNEDCVVTTVRWPS